MKLNLEDSNVHHVELTVTQARDFFNGSPMPEEFEFALDEAQGQVFTDAEPFAFIVIKITR